MENSSNLTGNFDVDPAYAADPEGGDLRGVSPGYNLEAGALGHPELLYQDRDGTDSRMYVDVYDDHVHMHCPLCAHAGFEHGVILRKGVKAWLYEPMAQVAFPGWDAARMMLQYPRGTGGRFSMDPVTCPWGTGENKHKFSIRNNVVKAE